LFARLCELRRRARSPIRRLALRTQSNIVIRTQIQGHLDD
jgi:hypothetical protein